jgi:serine/threonine protein kinase
MIAFPAIMAVDLLSTCPLVCDHLHSTQLLTLTTWTECGQTRPYARYATAPNDVWSLGVILVNLTCGRNPWKKASPEDSTFRAFLKDPSFLSSILPISPELNAVLQRIFECDPRHRITLDELRELILACPRFTNTCYNTYPPSPQPSYDYVDNMDSSNVALPPSPPRSPPSGFHGRPSDWAVFQPTSKQSSTYSCTSSDSGYESETFTPELGPEPVAPFNFYGNVIPLPEHDKPAFFNHAHYTPVVSAF